MVMRRPFFSHDGCVNPMNRWLLLCAALLAEALPLRAQSVDTEFDALRHGEMDRYLVRARSLLNTADIKRVVDVKYYKLNIRAADRINYLSGDVTAVSVVTDPVITSIEYNLTNTMVVDSALVDGVRSAFAAGASSFLITLPKTYRAGDQLTTRVFYHGLPASSGFGSYTDATRADSSRWIYTLSEPYGARDWWPCIDHPNDKADSADVWITCSQSLLAVSNGRLTETLQNSDGTKTYKWKERYPIATYLIAMTIANFAKISDWYAYAPADSMEVVNYVTSTIGATSPAWRTNTMRTPKMLAIYAALFGQYPFIREKYGHVEFGWPGGMEHQTLTSLGSTSFSEATIAHELAHQWFGDMITCRTWGDLWLNEGFATYCEAVYREKQYGAAAYIADLLSTAADAKRPLGSLYVQDTTSVNNLFASGRVYNKGAWVLHMLRHAVGDSLFFASMRAYANDPALMYGTASTADLRAAFERTTGRDLGWFFSEWVFGERYPVYSCQVSTVKNAGSFLSSVQIKQTTGTANPPFFIMPIDLRFASAGWDTTVTVVNNSQNQLLQIALSHKPDTVQFDPKNWVLKDAAITTTVNGVEGTEQPQSFFLAQNFPNPFNPLTVIRFGLAEPGRVTIKVYDIMGREAATAFDGEKAAGSYSVMLDAGTLSSGMYLYRMTAQHGRSVFSETKRLVVIK